MTQAANLAALGSNASSTGTLSASSFASATIPNSALSANPTFRNRLINGGMVIDQRNNGASSSSTGAYTVDRWYYAANLNKGTWGQNLNSITAPAGFTNYLGFQSSSSYSIASGDYFLFSQYIEGFNWSDLNWGTANAKTVTLSFWVRSSLTGTFGGVISNYAQNRCYPLSYTISAANTWEQKTITIAGDTSGTWVGASNAGAVQLSLALAVGSTYSGTAGAWSGSTYISSTGATSVVGVSGATFYFTGVQLEVGSAASPFEVRSYGTELNLCLRYYYMMSPSTQGSWNTGNSFATGYTYAGGDGMYYWFGFPVPMRATPTNLTMSAASTWSAVVGTVATPTSATCSGNTPYYGSFALTGGGCGFGSSGLCGRIRINSSNTYADFSAEL